MNNLVKLSAVSLLALSSSTFAAKYEFTPLVGYTFSDDIAKATDGSGLSVSDDVNIGFAFAWKASANGQGMILLNTTKHTYTGSDNISHSFDTTYAHFNGVAQFRQQDYITTVAMGIGGTYVKTDLNSKIYPSVTAAVGNRYELSNSFAIITEARFYATYANKNNNLFCKNSVCNAQYDSTLLLDANLSVGFAFKF